MCSTAAPRSVSVPAISSARWQSRGSFSEAHEDDAPLVGGAHHTPDAVIECVCVRQTAIQDTAVGIVAGAVRRSATELRTEEGVFDPGFAGSLQ